MVPLTIVAFSLSGVDPGVFRRGWTIAIQVRKAGSEGSQPSRKTNSRLTEPGCEGLRSRFCSLGRVNKPQFSDESGNCPDKNRHGRQKAHQLPLQLTHNLTDNS